MFIENPYQWGVSYDYALPLSENTLLHIHSHGAIHTYKLTHLQLCHEVRLQPCMGRQRIFLLVLKQHLRDVVCNHHRIFFFEPKCFFSA